MRTAYRTAHRVPSGAHAVAQFLRVIVHANLVIAMAAAGVAITSFFLLGVSSDPLLVGFAFGAAFIAYTLNRVWDRAEDVSNLPDRAAFIEAHRTFLMGLAVAAYGIAVLSLVASHPRIAMFAWLPPLAAWAYSGGPIKQTLLAKNVFVGAVWGCIPLGIGIVAGQPLAPATILATAIIVWMLTIAAILFDIKDIHGDRLAGVRTLPSVLGATRTRRLAGLGLVAAIPVILVAAVAVGPRFLILFGYVGYLAICVPVAQTDRGVLFYGLVIDGEHIVVGAVAAAWLAAV